VAVSFVQFGGRVFQQRIGIHKGTDRAPLFSDLFLHAYDAGFFRGHFKNKYKNRIAFSFLIIVFLHFNGVLFLCLFVCFLFFRSHETSLS
jgi:hypothetical protein